MYVLQKNQPHSDKEEAQLTSYSQCGRYAREGFEYKQKVLVNCIDFKQAFDSV